MSKFTVVTPKGASFTVAGGGYAFEQEALDPIDAAIIEAPTDEAGFIAAARRTSTGSSAACGTNRQTVAASQFARPGTTTPLSAARPSIPARATSSADFHMTLGNTASRSPLLNPAASSNSVATGPGHNAVAVTPVPRNSLRRLSV